VVWGCAHRCAGAINDIFGVSQLEAKYGIWSKIVNSGSVCLWDWGSMGVRIITPAHNIVYKVVLKHFLPRTTAISIPVRFCWSEEFPSEIIGFKVL